MTNIAPKNVASDVFSLFGSKKKKKKKKRKEKRKEKFEKKKLETDVFIMEAPEKYRP